MRKDECYRLGHIVKTHGLKGAVTIELDVDYPEEYDEMESVFLEQSGNLIPFFIEHISINGNRGLIQFEDINTIQLAKSIVGSSMFLPTSLLPSLNKGEYFYHDLVGFDVFDGQNHLGKIDSIFQPSSQYLAAVFYKDQELLIPIEDAIFKNVDLIKKEAHISLPEGFMQIYFSDEN
ncbi:MAG: 16S rRNA processing protein RimM [Flammeovirgaceae bacterium]|jgi:16S rRNA processing protein RimM|nr:16S rRNA processing protein RimM [Flammeovirgaceae bacterium]|tara:strand:- start:2772 stop:3302 length:531 start_codon:yes stop_codon:yes gene_type:complete